MKEKTMEKNKKKDPTIGDQSTQMQGILAQVTRTTPPGLPLAMIKGQSSIDRMRASIRHQEDSNISSRISLSKYS
jgi:hypothetical protein